MDETDRTPLHQALQYAYRGWPVFPLYEPCACTLYPFAHCACHKGRSCESPAKHPRTEHGLTDATTDAEKVRRWWARWPKANVGVATGGVAGIFVLDVDPRHGGDASLGRLEDEHGRLPRTATARTGGGGLHFVFRHPGGKVKSRAALADGLDVRGDGGYIVAPPSRHDSGPAYGWVSDPREVADAPDWLVELVRVEPRRATTGRGGSDGERIPDGKRNETLASLAGTMRRRGMSEASIEAALLAENRERCAPPLDESEVVDIARSVARYQPEPAPPVLVRLVRPREKAEPTAAIPPVPELCWRYWFETYRDAVAPTTEAPDVYHLGAALVMAGAVLKRRVWVDYGGPVYPNVFCILVGASGRNRKDTAIRRALTLLDAPDLRAPSVDRLNMVSSAEGLVERLAEGRAVVLHLSEVSILLRNAKRESTSSIIPYLTNIFDCPPVLALSTRKNPVTAHNPFLSILGGTTPEWFDTDVDEDMIRGGFLGRFLYLNGDPKPAIDLPPKPDGALMRWLRTTLYGLVDELDRTGGREYHLSDAARTWWSAWYAEESKRAYFGDLDVLFQRVHLYVQKVALLYAAVEQAEWIEPEHLEAAAAFVRLSQAHVEVSHPKWGASLDAKLTNKVIDYIRERGGCVTKRELHQRLSGRVPSQVFGNVLRTMQAFHRIELPDDRHVALPGYTPPAASVDAS